MVRALVHALLHATPRGALLPATIRCLSSSTPSVTGVVYSGPSDRPTVKLFTKAGCTLCDVAKDVLKGAAAEQPHTLESVDITDPEHAEWWDKYKYDIPVLHINGIYWAKHRITAEDSLAALAAADSGTLEPSRGEPNAAKMERS